MWYRQIAKNQNENVWYIEVYNLKFRDKNMMKSADYLRYFGPLLLFFFFLFLSCPPFCASNFFLSALACFALIISASVCAFLLISLWARFGCFAFFAARFWARARSILRWLPPICHLYKYWFYISADIDLDVVT